VGLHTFQTAAGIGRAVQRKHLRQPEEDTDGQWTQLSPRPTRAILSAGALLNLSQTP